MFTGLIYLDHAKLSLTHQRQNQRHLYYQLNQIPDRRRQNERIMNSNDLQVRDEHMM